ncbi:nuclear transport factor 2 family protein [Streptomyces longisporoflavus]|uniref:Nuclear transport factor 2 family protein n=1 Tax=Streptomyces longisporoflavus TaxID=28044 RepID=A0ABW7R296_9ACTN
MPSTRPLIPAFALSAALLLAGCSEGSDQPDSPSGSTQQAAAPDKDAKDTKNSTDSKDSKDENRKDEGVEPAAQAYVDAVADEDLEGLVDAFHSDAQLTDVGRKFNGHEEIRDWARNEVIGGKLTVLKDTPQSNGTTLLVRFAPGGTGGFEANYEFQVRDGRIAKLDLQYA